MVKKLGVVGCSLALAVGCAGVSESEGVGTGESMAVTDVVRMTARADGSFDVECRGKNGSPNWKEVATQAQILSNAVCETSPGLGSVQGMTSRADGSFDVACKAGSGAAWTEVRTAAEVQSNQVCLAPPPAPSCTGGMCAIPAGSFQMGSNNGFSDEQPVHTETVGAFLMDEFEVTVDQYAACVSAGKCTAADTGGSCNAGVAGRGNHPINCVDWNQADAYCTSLGKRLPTEVEWEYAARGTDGRKYPWGNAAPASQLCWSGGGTNRSSTCAVGSYPSGKSPFGVQDMAGNVWEWTSSLYTDDYNSAPTGTARVIRGGSWSSYASSDGRSADRRDVGPSILYRNLGFRCAR